MSFQDSLNKFINSVKKGYSAYNIVNKGPIINTQYSIKDNVKIHSDFHMSAEPEDTMIWGANSHRWGNKKYRVGK